MKIILHSNLLYIPLFLFTLFSGLFIFASSYSQVIVMDIVQVKDGMNAQYEAVEKFAEPIKREAVKMGKQLGWYIMKRKSGGDLSELENKGIGDYIILKTTPSSNKLIFILPLMIFLISIFLVTTYTIKKSK